MSVKQTLERLNALDKLGFNNEAFWRLHHFRDKGTEETIGSFRGYLERNLNENVNYTPGVHNNNVRARLDFVLNTYIKLGLSHGQTKVFVALADASFYGIPRR